jgi:hypothetical protein
MANNQYVDGRKGSSPGGGKGSSGPAGKGSSPGGGKGQSGPAANRKEAIFLGSSSKEAGIILRASVEAFGPVGETTLTLTVNWPATSVVEVSPDADSPADPVATRNPGEGPNIEGPAT